MEALDLSAESMEGEDPSNFGKPWHPVGSSSSQVDDVKVCDVITSASGELFTVRLFVCLPALGHS
jgi:hypothetical protein